MFNKGSLMICIVYGSPAAGLPNNLALSSADLADDAAVNAQYLRTGSSNYPPRPVKLFCVTLDRKL
jgi:hypothetical protein